MLPPLTTAGRPHWETRFPKEVWPAFEDFRNFLILVWEHHRLPDPTEAQLEIAHRLQYGADSVEWVALSAEERETRVLGMREDIIRAFRALGKSYVTSAFASWLIARNPRDELVLVVSATGSKSKEFVSQTKNLMISMPLLQWLVKGTRLDGSPRRDKSEEFDVAGSGSAQSYSVAARGITGQITGSRATTLIADDIEIPGNSKTEDARATILNAVRSDFGPIRDTEHGRGDLYFLGTPQTEESVYNVLVKEMGFGCFTIPVRFPAADKLKNYQLKLDDRDERVNILAPYLLAKHDAGKLDHGAPTDTRHTPEDLIKQESQGRAAFALQYMLDTELSDAERYPLKQRDLIIMSTNVRKAPLTVQWGRHSDAKNVIQDISNVGFSGDILLRPLFIDSEWRDYEGSVLFVDPAGMGKDETAWAVVAQLGGSFYGLKVDGYVGQPAEAMRRIAMDAKAFNVNIVEVEPNFAGGVWVEAFKPILQQVANLAPKWDGCGIQESEWAKGQKETRVLGIMEPVMSTHRLILNEDVVRADVDRYKKREFSTYSLMYQLTHLTGDRGSLRHDDRLEALAGGIAHFTAALAMDTDEARKGVMEDEKQQMVDEFCEDFEEGYVIAQHRGFRRGKRRADGSREEVFIL